MSRLSIKLLLSGIMLFAIPTFSAFALTVSASVDRNPVQVDESVQLTFSAGEEPDDDPDFSPLLNNFDIINQQRSNNVSMINGSFSKRYTWVLSLMPKRSGTLSIPVISFGDDQSQALSLTVVADEQQQDDHDKSAKALFLDVKVEPEQAYVQQQLLYTMRFYSRVGIAQASLTEPEAENAIIERLGDDKNFNTRINGMNYRVVERRYAIFPQQSGTLHIAPLQLTAQVISGQRSRFDGFFGSQSTRTKRVSSNAITLDVQAIPDSFRAKHWLPARQLVLQEKWSGDINAVKVGEPVTRTLTLLAKGASASQLPEILPQSEMRELKFYPDQPVLKDDMDAQGMISIREEKIAYIPSAAGQYRLPAVTINWWNTESGRMQSARIPEVLLIAVGGADESAQTEVSPVQTNTEKPTKLVAEKPLQNPETGNEMLWIVLAGFFACGWLGTLVYFLSTRKNNQPEKPATPDPEYISQSELRKCCRENDAEAVKNQLIRWGRGRFQGSSLRHIAEHCDEPLQEQILLLNAAIYQPGSNGWQQGEALLQAFQQQTTAKQSKKLTADVLEPLYKT